MANVNKPSGLVPVAYLSGAPWSGQCRMYCIPSTDNNAFAVGDPMVLAGSADANGVATVTLASAGSTNQVLGALVSGAGGTVYGGAFGVPQESPIVIPATKTRAYYVGVADDPNIIFEVQEIGTGTVFTAAEISLNCSLVSGTNNGYVSGWLLDNSTETTTSTLQMKILGLAIRTDNAFGQYAKYLCLINNHCYRPGQTGL